MFKFIIITILVAIAIVLVFTRPVQQFLQAVFGISVLVFVSSIIGGMIYLSFM